MTSANDTPNADFDERLAKALEEAMAEGEQLVARETGDQGQAIALTSARILIAKAGFAATGELDGHKVSTFELPSITAVNLRKGPLGAVIQVCAEGNGAAPQGGTPDNVVVFTGPGRVKKAEAFAAQVETVAGKEVKRIPTGKPTLAAAPPRETVQPETAQPEATQPEMAQPVENQPVEASVEAPAEPKGGRVAKSLAEEIYGEVVGAEEVAEKPEAPEQVAAAAPPPETKPAKRAHKPAVAVPEAAPAASYNANPRLPKPIRKQKQGPRGVLVLLGITAGLALIGMAIMAPVRQAQNRPAYTSQATHADGQKMVVGQLNSVSNYHAKIGPLVASANAEAAAVRSAVASGDRAATAAAGGAPKTDAALTEISNTEAPSGLAEARENLRDGLLTQKTAIAAAAAVAQSSDPMPNDILRRLTEANTRINRGMAAISRTEESLKKQMGAAKSGTAR